MVCEACRYVNKDTAEVCRHCGAVLKEKPQTIDLEIKTEPKAAKAGSFTTPKSLTAFRGPRMEAAPRAVKVDLPQRKALGFSEPAASPSQKNYGFSGDERPKTVKTVSFTKPQEDRSAAELKQDYNMEAAKDEFEEDDVRDDARRDNIKFIAIVASLIVFVVGAIIVFALLLFGKPGANSPASAVTAQPSPTVAAETSPASEPTTAETRASVN